VETRREGELCAYRDWRTEQQLMTCSKLPSENGDPALGKTPEAEYVMRSG
jgi:hypothetical protein